MSEEFIQFDFPCDICLVQAACKDKAGEESKKINRQRKICIAIPAWNPNEKAYIKGFLECLLNLGWDATKELNRLKNHRTDPGIDKSFSIPEQYIDFITSILGTLQWIINSTSWSEGELYKFDADEIKNKIKNLHYWLEDGK